ncbi:MAG TPA: hypothetical protein EYO62_04685, partial [Aquificales bacterium]|nr:hypothetical protein [Aquificales bacterium]
MKLKFYRDYVIGKFKESLFATFIGVVSGLAASLLDFFINFFHTLSFGLKLQFFHLMVVALYMAVVASMES